MTRIHERSMIPIERYRQILGALDIAHADRYGAFWLRFAAHLAVLSPQEPPAIAKAIRSLAAELHERTAWYSALHGPIRFAVAAILQNHALSTDDFLAEDERVRELFRAESLRHGGWHESLAVLILLFTDPDGRIDAEDAQAVKRIYEGMKKNHWWLTGPEDLPAAAALSHHPGVPSTIIAEVEGCYEALTGYGLLSGDHLQTAANLLPLTGLPHNESVVHFMAYHQALQSDAFKDCDLSYEAIVPLTLLDQDVEAVLAAVRDVEREVELSQGVEFGPSNWLLAADLVFLDFIRHDDDGTMIDDSDDLQRVLRRLHAFHVISLATLSLVDHDRESMEFDAPYGFGL